MYTLDEFHSILVTKISAGALGHRVKDKSWTIFGVRACSIQMKQGESLFIKTENTFNKYDDLLCILRGDEMKCFQGTVDPGRKYTDTPMNPKGCAHLLNGLHWFKKGLHKGFPAFNQAKPVQIWRDRNRNNENDDGFEEEGFFGIDIHYGSGNRNKIEGWSAGCINTLGDRNSSAWRDFRNTLYDSAQPDYGGLYPLIVTNFPEDAE
ncbi:hypothetical protein LEP1GSC188_3407 [Leptospira weilii serovar Topaz str. LT2116]|uniref:Uncharacterized protein n=1 Tax=Leptospira weilii serovar Topaz str. LT2116 TaxID=1088540 RepID=M3G898_9LEPT|nr:hypothetical protein LEP1GSC188_3407 [Leptospira weilii serovar Topaz str. LT2116]